jgi:hypothetical protein
MLKASSIILIYYNNPFLLIKEAYIHATMTENDPKFWRPLRGYRAQLAATTYCRYMEVLKYPGDLGLQTWKGAVSEVSLESWLTTV